MLTRFVASRAARLLLESDPSFQDQVEESDWPTESDSDLPSDGDSDPPELPGEVTDVQATAVGEDEVEVTFTAAPGALLHDLRHSPQGEEDWTEVETFDSGDLVVGLSEGTEYDFQVRGVNDDGDGPWSASVQETTLDLPGDVTDVQASAVGEDEVEVTFTSAPGALSHDLRHSPQGEDDWTEVASFDSGDSVTGLSDGTAYDFQVRGVNADGDGPWSASAQETTLDLPEQIADLAASEGSDQWHVQLGYTPDPVATSHQFRYSLAGAGSWSSPIDVDDLASTLFEAATAYDFQVRGSNADGDGPWSATDTVTTGSFGTVDYVEGFDYFNAVSDAAFGITSKWTLSSSANVSLIAGRDSHGQAMRMAQNRTIDRAINASQHVCFGIDMRFAAFIASGSARFVQIAAASAGSRQCSLNIGSTGVVSLNVGGSGVAGSGAFTVSLDTWHSFEVEVFVAQAPDGWVKIWVDGVLRVNASGIDTQEQASNTVGNVRVQCGSALQTDFDNFWIGHDGNLGGAEPKRVMQRKPTAESSCALTPSTGTDNSALVDDDTMNSTSGDQVSTTSSTPLEDLYEMADVGYTPREIWAVKYAAALSGTAATVNIIDRLSGTTRAGGNITPPAGTTYQHGVRTTRPAGGRWQRGDWDALTAGLRISTTSGAPACTVFGAEVLLARNAN